MPVTYDPFDDDPRYDPLREDIDDANEIDETIPCPSCQRSIYEDVDQCPHCGEWIIAHATSDVRRRTVWIVTSFLALLAILLLTVL